MKSKFRNKKIVVNLAFLLAISAIPSGGLFAAANTAYPVAENSVEVQAVDFSSGFRVISQSQNQFDANGARQTLPQFQNAETPQIAANNYAQNTFAYSNINSSAASIIVGSVKNLAPLTVNRATKNNQSIEVASQSSSLHPYQLEQGSSSEQEKAITQNNSVIKNNKIIAESTSNQSTEAQSYYAFQYQKQNQFNLKC